MKRTILLLIVIILLLTSCSLEGTHMLSNLFRSDKEIANECFEKVIYAIQNQDYVTFKELFSKESIASANKFDDNMNKLFELYKGEEISYNDWGGPNTNYGINDEGPKRKWKNMQSTYDVITDMGTYRFAIKIIIMDTADADSVGIHSLYVMKAGESNIQFAYWGDGNWTPGIVIEYK